MTGMFFRVLRDGQWVNIEIEHLTKEEFRERFENESREYLLNTIQILNGNIRAADLFLKSLEDDGFIIKNEN